MGLMDKIKNKLFEDDDEVYEDEETGAVEEEDYFNTRPAKNEKNERTVTASSAAAGGLGGIQVVIVKPERFEDASAIGEHLCQKKTVVLNLESATKDTAKRLIDFLSGVAYANRGNIKRVANNTFIITPANVDVTGDMVIEELESGTLYL